MSDENCYLNKNDIPKQWYNILSEIGEKMPKDKEPEGSNTSKIELMEKIRIPQLIEQDHSTKKFIDIPEEVLESYIKVGRPTPLMRVKKLEEYLDTPAEIYFKREDLLPTHSFKLNSAFPQIYYGKKNKYKGVISETGAGQWGLALSYAASVYGMECIIFWVKVSRKQKMYRAAWSALYGATIYDSPSTITETGRKMLEQYPECPGSLGISIGEAIEKASKHMGEYSYVSGSNLPHVLLHQTIIGQETKKQFVMINRTPDILVSCCGGGSNLGGFIGPFVFDDDFTKNKITFIAAESTAAPRLTQGQYKYDHADPLGLTPLSKSYTLGKDYMPPPIHVGGLRQHNGSPVVSYLRHHGFLDARAYTQEEALEAGKLFIKLYSVIPAPETCHAIKCVIDEALEAKKRNKKKVIAACFSGGGLLDIMAYSQNNSVSK